MGLLLCVRLASMMKFCDVLRQSWTTSNESGELCSELECRNKLIKKFDTFLRGIRNMFFLAGKSTQRESTAESFALRSSTWHFLFRTIAANLAFVLFNNKGQGKFFVRFGILLLFICRLTSKRTSIKNSFRYARFSFMRIERLFLCKQKCYGWSVARERAHSRGKLWLPSNISLRTKVVFKLWKFLEYAQSVFESFLKISSKF